MQIEYKCRCSEKVHAISVREREIHRDEDVADWMMVVRQAVGRHHKAVAPKCRETKTEYIRIPAPHADWPIGVQEH